MALKLLQGIQIGLTLLLLFLVLLLLLRSRTPDALRTENPTQPQGNRRKEAERAHAVKGRLLVVRGAKPNWEYLLYEGVNILGRSDDKPADIDLGVLEAGPDRLFSSFQHAAITCEGDTLVIEDLKSANGTHVNRERVPPGQKRRLQVNDIIQIGEIYFQVVIP